jgi:hypothetical protein
VRYVLEGKRAARADESTRAAREWIAKNASKTGVARPTISEGTVMLQLK